MKTAKESLIEILSAELPMITDEKRENIASLIIKKFNLERVRILDVGKEGLVSSTVKLSET